MYEKIDKVNIELTDSVILDVHNVIEQMQKITVGHINGFKILNGHLKILKRLFPTHIVILIFISVEHLAIH